jgi:hypothetical protein
MVIMHNGAPCVGMRARADGQGRPSTPGFVPMEGPHLGIFQSDYVLEGAPAILPGDLVQIIVQQPEPSAASKHSIKVGDICFLPGHSHACMAVAATAGLEPSGFLVLAGELMGEILRGHWPQIRVGKIAVVPIAISNPTIPRRPQKV